jgi:hypothetical protein
MSGAGRDRITRIRSASGMKVPNEFSSLIVCIWSLRLSAQRSVKKAGSSFTTYASKRRCG